MIEQTKKLRLDELKVDSFITTTGTSGTNEIVGGGTDSALYFGEFICMTGPWYCNINTDPGPGNYKSLEINCNTVGALCMPPNSGNVQCINGLRTNEQQCPTGGWGAGGNTCNVVNCSIAGC